MFYVVWDYFDDVVFEKRHASDCVQFALFLGFPSSGE